MQRSGLRSRSLRSPAVPAVLFFASLFVSPLLTGQVSATFSGYVVQFPVYQRLNEALAGASGTSRDQTVDASRVRFRPVLTFGDHSFLAVEHEISALYTFNTLGLLGASTTARRQVVDLSWDPATGPRWYVRHFVDRAYLRTSLSDLEITIGRQRIAWGSGRVWNPTDLFNPLSPTSFSKVEKDGADAMVMKGTLGQFSDLEFVWNPQKDLPSNYGVRLRSNLDGFDLAGIAGIFDTRMTFGADVAGSVMDAGVRFELLFSSDRKGNGGRFVRWIAGADNQFTDRLYGLCEIQFNGEGMSDRFSYDVLRLFRGEILNVARQYGTVGVSYLIHPLVTASGTWLQNWTDGSGMMGGSVNVSLTDETAGAIGVQFFHGSPFSEYWYFPTTLYARVDAYF